MNGFKGSCLFCNFKSDENSPHVTRSTIIPKFVKNQNLSVCYTTLKNEKKYIFVNISTVSSLLPVLEIIRIIIVSSNDNLGSNLYQGFHFTLHFLLLLYTPY